MSSTRQFNVKSTLKAAGKPYAYYSLKAAEAELGDLSRIPFTLKILLENLLRFEDGESVTGDHIKSFANWATTFKKAEEIAYTPARVLMQDFTGVPAVVDLAAMRQAMVDLGGNPKAINPLSPVDLVIDHSVMVDSYASNSAFDDNVAREFDRNKERYEFLKWGQGSLDNFRAVPPGTGICHQVNLEYLGQTVWTKEVNGETVAYPDTLVGTDSHTTMVNGLAILGWGVGGIEAEAAMLGQAVSMQMPEVIGFKLTGKMSEGTTATDLVLYVVQMLRAKGVVGKFVEFYGPGLDNMTLADRATIANMAPEYGATCGFFPIDQEALNYLEFTGRDKDRIALVEEYAKAQGMWRDANTPDPIFADTLELDMSTVQPALAGPKRPQDKVLLSDMVPASKQAIQEEGGDKATPTGVSHKGEEFTLDNGKIVIAAITSCTNTSNPSVMVGAGLVARKANALGLKVKPWVKTSLAPGSQVVTDYLEKADVQKDLDAMGFNLVGYGCTTCIGNSGPLDDPISDGIRDGDLAVASVLSGNRNFEGRVHPQVKLNYLASPPLVVAYALAGSLDIDLQNDALGQDKDGNDVFLKDIWPTNQEIQDVVNASLTPEMFESRYSNVFTGPKEWQALPDDAGLTYNWDDASTYVKLPHFFTGMTQDLDTITDIKGARPLAILGDSVTTDHISPAGAIKRESPAGDYLVSKGVPQEEFNSFGSRRGNHEIMMRGTFANIRLQNEMVTERGGYTKHMPDATQMSIFEAAMRYQENGTPLVVIGGKEYGTGSSRDWAAKGTRLLGVKAVVTESFERIHRSNLVGMGVLPLNFKPGTTRQSLGLTGAETFDVLGLTDATLTPGMDLELAIHYADGSTTTVPVTCRLDTANEVKYYQNGGILHFVLRNLLKASNQNGPVESGEGVVNQ